MATRTSRAWIATLCLATTVACSSAEDPGGAQITARSCRIGDPCNEGAECGWSGWESGVSCVCDPSGHIFCDPSLGGGAAPAWPPCTEPSAANGSGACEDDPVAPGNDPPTACTETNGWCTRTCTCGGTCEMTCDGEGPTEPQAGVVCEPEFCAEDQYYASCEFIDGDCDYRVVCDSGQADVTGACP